MLIKNCNLSCMKQNCARVAWAGMGYKLQPELCETELCLDSAWVELGCVINCRQAGCLPATHHASCLADLFSGKTLSALHSPDDHPHSSLLLSSNDLNIHYPTPQFMPSHNCIVKTAKICETAKHSVSTFMTSSSTHWRSEKYTLLQKSRNSIWRKTENTKQDSLQQNSHCSVNQQ